MAQQAHNIELFIIEYLITAFETHVGSSCEALYFNFFNHEKKIAFYESNFNSETVVSPSHCSQKQTKFFEDIICIRKIVYYAMCIPTVINCQS